MYVSFTIRGGKVKMKSTKEDSRPGWFWYPKDWMSDTGLKMSSLAARGLWIELLNLMFFSPVRGALIDDRKMQIPEKDLAKIIPNVNANEMQKLLKELEVNKVFSRLENGVIINRKMYRDGEISRKRSKAANARWYANDGIDVDTKDMQNAEEAIAVVSLGVDKAVKIKYLDFVYLLEAEYLKLIAEYGKSQIAGLMERLNNYIGSKGVKYKSHYHTLLNWAGRDVNIKKITPVIKKDTSPTPPLEPLTPEQEKDRIRKMKEEMEKAGIKIRNIGNPHKVAEAIKEAK